MKKFLFLSRLTQRVMWGIAITWHLSSAVNFYILKPLGQLAPNLVAMFVGWSSKKFVFFLVNRKYTKETSVPKVSIKSFVSFEFSSLKPLGQFESNLVGMLIWCFSRKLMGFFCWSEVHKRNKRPSFESSSLKPQGLLEPNFVVMFIWWSSKRLRLYFVDRKYTKETRGPQGLRKRQCIRWFKTVEIIEF